MPNLILTGQDIAEYGGAFKILERLVSDHSARAEGPESTPLWQERDAIAGCFLELSLEGPQEVSS